MAGKPDVYEAWLGIPPGPRPPNHYELLGLPSFAAEPPVIAEAIDATITKVRAYTNGSQAGDAQRLLTEIGRAKKVLLDSVARKEYENQLRGTATPNPAAASAPAAPPMSPPPAMPASASAPPTASGFYPAAATAQPAAPMAMMPAAAPAAMPASFPEAAPVMAVPVQAAPVQTMPMQAMPIQAGQMPMAQMAMPMSGAPFAAPMQGVPMQAAPFQPGAPMAQMAPVMGAPVMAAPVMGAPVFGAPVGQSPLAGEFNPNSASATKVDYRRKKRSQNKLALQLIGASLGLLVGVLIFANWNNIRPAPVYPVAAKAPEPAAPEPPIYAKPNLSALTGKASTSNPPNDQEKALKQSLSNEFSKSLDRAKITPATSPEKMFQPSGEAALPGASTPPKKTTPKKTPEPTPEPPKPAAPKEVKKADAKETAAVKKLLDEARLSLRTYKLEKATESMDLATLEATPEADTSVAIDRMKEVIAANQQFWDAVVAGGKGLKALEELKEGDEVVGNVVEVDDAKAIVKLAGRNQTVLFNSPDKADAKLLVLLVEKALGKGTPEANLCLGAFHMSHAKGDMAQARPLLEAAGTKGQPLLAELDSHKT